MAELVPGYANLGLGFNSFGSYDSSATDGMARLFGTSTPSFNTWKNPASGVEYQVPENVLVSENEKRSAQSVVFEARSELSEFLSLQTNLKGNYLAFSGALSSQFTGIAKSVSEFQFGMAYAYTDGYSLKLDESTWNYLLPEVQNDPDIKSLPPKFDDSSREAYFRVLEKYGAYFVESVHMGGRVFYNASIEKSFGLSSSEVKANLSLEYAAVFALKAGGDWSKVNKTWASNRSVHIQAIGGDDNILNIIQPTEGKSYATAFESWVNSVGGRPGPVGFTLREFASLFSGDQADQLRSAAKEFTASSLRLAGQDDGLNNIILNGDVLLHVPPPDGVGWGAVSVAVVDPKTLKVLAKANFGINVLKGRSERYAPLLKLVEPYRNNRDCIIAVVIGPANSYSAYPTGDAYDFLLSLGAGAGLQQWLEPSGSATAPNAGYAIVGMPGLAPNGAQEDINVQKNYTDRSGFDLYAPLRPVTTAQGIVYEPS